MSDYTTRLSLNAIELYKHRDSDDFKLRCEEFVTDNVDDLIGVCVRAAGGGDCKVVGEHYDWAVANGFVIIMQNVHRWDDTRGVDFHPWLQTLVKYRLIDIKRSEGEWTRTEIKVLKAIEDASYKLLAKGITPCNASLVEQMIEDKVASENLIRRVLLNGKRTEISWSDLDPAMSGLLSGHEEAENGHRSRDIKTSDERSYGGSGGFSEESGRRLGYNKADRADYLNISPDEVDRERDDSLVDDHEFYDDRDNDLPSIDDIG